MMKNPIRRACARHLMSRWGAAMLAGLSLAEAAPVTYTYFRFTPTQTRTAGNVLCQMSEFVFYHGSSLIDRTGVVVTNPGGGSPGAETPAKLVDGLVSSKWLGGFGTPNPPIGSLIFQFPAPITMDGYAFATANDGNDRDPVSWTLEGSTDGATWDPIDTVDNYPVPTARLRYLSDVTRPAVYDFYSDVGIIPNGEEAFLFYTTARATDAEVNPGAIAVTPGFADASIFPPDDSETQITLTASNGGADPATAALTIRTVEPTTRTFRYVRFTPVKLRDTAGANSVQITEFDFFNQGTEVVPVNIAIDGTPNSPDTERVGNLIDGVLTNKWLSFNKFAPVIFDFGAPTALDAYQFYTGGDAPARDPVRWVLEARNDPADPWQLIDSVTSFDFPTATARNTKAQFINIPLGEGQAPGITTFAGQAPVLILGGSETLRWEVIGADSVSINQGVGTVASSGSIQVTPTATTTYTLTATAGIYSSTQTYTIEVIDPGVSDVCYENFNTAGSEFQMIGTARFVNDSAVIVQPGNITRLRLTDDGGNQAGTAWFRKKINIAGGFDMSCGLHMVSPAGNGGADGMSFVIQNSPAGTLSTVAEDGLATGGLAVCFDSYLNSPEPSGGFIEIRSGTTSLALVDLAPLGIVLAGSDTTKFTDNQNNSAPYEVRVTYTSADGTLDVYFQGVHVIDSLAVDLMSLNQVIDANGEAFVGFGARTGGSYQAHDVTHWCITAGDPVPQVDLDVTGVSLQGNQLTVEFLAPAGTATSAFMVEGSSTLESFPDDKTAVSTITEVSAGLFRAVVDVTGAGSRYFVRIALP